MMETIVEIIRTFGFPIACCVALAYYIKKQNDEYREDIKEMSDEYRADVKNITEKYESALNRFSASLDKNTQALVAIKPENNTEGEQEA